MKSIAFLFIIYSLIIIINILLCSHYTCSEYKQTFVFYIVKKIYRYFPADTEIPVFSVTSLARVSSGVVCLYYCKCQCCEHLCIFIFVYL